MFMIGLMRRKHLQCNGSVQGQISCTIDDPQPTSAQFALDGITRELRNLTLRGCRVSDEVDGIVIISRAHSIS
jgi:hypothetical protein